MFDWNEEQRMIRGALRQLIAREIEPHVDAMERGEPPYAPMRKLGESLGLADVAPKLVASANKRVDSAGSDEDDAGRARDPYTAAIVAIELSRCNPGFALAFGATLGLCGRTILKAGTPEQRERWALPVMSLAKIGAWAITEPGSGSDAFGMRTTARRAGEGRYVLNGSKTFITNAPYADVMVVYAKLADDESGKRPPQAFVVERGMKGLSTGKPLEKMGMHSSPTGEIFLEDVEVTREHLLGGVEKEPAQGQVFDVFKGERTGVASMCLGILDRVLTDALAYAKERVSWGKPIAEYQLIQDKLARMLVARENVKNLVLKQLWAEKNGHKVTFAAASACKLYSTRATTDACLEAVQIMGGNGYMREYQVERFMRDAKLLQIGGGTDEIQILHIAKDLIANGLVD